MELALHFPPPHRTHPAAPRGSADGDRGRDGRRGMVTVESVEVIAYRGSRTVS